MRKSGSYRPLEYYQRSAAIRRVLDAIKTGRFSGGQPDLFGWIYQNLVEKGDYYFHLADFESYVAAQERAAQTFQDRRTWDKMAILNVARIGTFSSDRTINQYAKDIWGIEPVR
jgi:starch phosphorylase